uniref:Protein kinase domain-containing protein n=1 Tax=Oryzias melastigma TaxID=30732 RepID=A0A3B3BQX1_ORYME
FKAPLRKIRILDNSAQYLVEKLLGEGAYGKVAKCRNLTTKQEVAVKIIKPSDRDSALESGSCRRSWATPPPSFIGLLSLFVLSS